jgi:hypothetical protein
VRAGTKICESDLQKFEGLVQERRKGVVLRRSDVLLRDVDHASLKNAVSH